MRLINALAGCTVCAHGIEQYRTVSCICPPRLEKYQWETRPQASVDHPTNREICFLEIEFGLGARFAGHSNYANATFPESKYCCIQRSELKTKSAYHERWYSKFYRKVICA